VLCDAVHNIYSTYIEYFADPLKNILETTFFFMGVSVFLNFYLLNFFNKMK